MCKDTIDSERVQIQERLFNEQLYENRQLATENNTLRAELAEVKEQLQAERQRSTSLYTRHQEFVEWTRQLFRNKTIPESSKLVLWQYHLNISSMRDDPIDSEMRVSVEDTADAIGVSTSTVRKATDKADMFDVLKRRYEQLEINGEKRTVMHISLNPIVSTPQKIQMEKHHGGKRIPSCPSCGGTDVDRYTVQYCRVCKTNTWYGQPGLRADSDVMQAQQAQDANMQNRLKKQDAFEPSASTTPIDEFYEDPQPEEVLNDEPITTIHTEDAIHNETSKKQDAFEPSASTTPIDEFYEDPQPEEVLNDEPITTIHTEDAIHNETSKKQDAFEPSASTTLFLKKQNQLATELHTITTAASCFTEHRPTCRICGPIKQWIWSEIDQARICPKCWTVE